MNGSPSAFAGPVHAFLAGEGLDHRGRSLDGILAFDDQELEAVHDFIQWLFPLREASRSVPGAPVLTPQEAEAIRRDPRAVAGLRRSAARMRAFYGAMQAWLARSDHNHLRITRVLTAVRDLVGDADARAFYEEVTARNRAAGGPIDPNNLAYWRRALEA